MDSLYKSNFLSHGPKCTLTYTVTLTRLFISLSIFVPKQKKMKDQRDRKNNKNQKHNTFLTGWMQQSWVFSFRTILMLEAYIPLPSMSSAVLRRKWDKSLNPKEEELGCGNSTMTLNHWQPSPISFISSVSEQGHVLPDRESQMQRQTTLTMRGRKDPNSFAAPPLILCYGLE